MLAQQITHSSQVATLIARHGPWAGLFYTWCLPFVDDDSRLIGAPDQLRHKVLGRFLGEVSEADVAAYLATLNEIDLVVWYEVVGVPEERYLYFPKFSLHQTLRTDRYGPSRHPAPPGWQPEEGHPYTKNAELQKAKPQRDRRRTRRVPRPGNKGEGVGSATAGQPLGDGSAPSGDEASLFLASPRFAIPRPSAVPRASAPPSAGSRAASLQDAGSSETTSSYPLEGQAREDRLLRVLPLLAQVADERWRKALEDIACRMTLANFETWFPQTTLEERGDWAIVRAPNSFAKDWLSKKLRKTIADALGTPLHRVVFALPSEDVQLEPEPIDEDEP